MKKYVLCPDYIISTTDGDRHFISAPQLAQLYGVSMAECYVRRDPHPRTYPKEITYLYPRQDGNYIVPTKELQ